MILAGVEQGIGADDPMIEEAQACLFGLQCAKDAELLSLSVEEDCSALVSLLRSSCIQDTFIGFIVRDFISLIEDLLAFTLGHSLKGTTIR